MSNFCSASSSSCSNLQLFDLSQNRNALRFHPPVHTSPSHSISCSLKSSVSSLLVVDSPEASKSSPNPKLLEVRRPLMETSEEEEEESDSESSTEESDTVLEESSSSAFSIDAELSRFARKMPIFEPDRVAVSSSGEKPLRVNLDLALYKAKVLARKFQYAEAEKILQKCIYYWPEDGRAYVTLGKILRKQSKVNEARSVYENGCQATLGENPYIWQSWAVMESTVGKIRRARELFDAATVADKRHIGAWHGWAILELKQGNIKKARNLLGKGLKYCGGNEYVYQTLALLEAKAKRYEQARYLFNQATKCNPMSCASWLAWAQLEAQLENIHDARQLFEKAVQASPKNRFAWHVWGVFEASLGNVDVGRKLLHIGYILNPRDPVILQSLALIEYKNSSANLARLLFQKASELDPRHQPVWSAWGWMEWKEGNISTARELYKKVLSINSSNEHAARCLQAWGVLEQRAGNLSAARTLFRSSLNINSQSYVTWMTWAALEEEQGNSVRADEIRNFYFQQRTDISDDESWVMGFLDFIDPAVDSLKRILNLDQNDFYKVSDSSKSLSSGATDDNPNSNESSTDTNTRSRSGFNLDNFIRRKLSLEPSKLESQFDSYLQQDPKKKITSPVRVWRRSEQTSTTSTKV